MKKILLIPLLFICFFASVKAQVINLQSQKYLKRVWVEGPLFSDSVMVASDSTNRVPNSAWIKRSLKLKLNISDTAAMLFPYQHKVTGGFILNNLTNTPQNARISLSDSIKTTGVVQSSMINTDSIKYNMPWMGGGVILPGISEIKQSITVPGRLGFYASAIGTTLAEKASLRNGGGMLAISGRYNDGPAFMVADSDYISHTYSTYYFAGSKGKAFLGFLHQNSTYTLTITPSNGIRTAIRYDSIGNVGIMQRTGVFTAFGKAAYNEAQPLTALSFLYKGRTDSLYAPISGSVNYIQSNLTNTPQSARISVSDSIKTSGVIKAGALSATNTNTNSIDVSSNSFVWDNPSILTQFANSQASYAGIYNSFVTYGYNQFGSGNATLKVVPSQYVLQSFARDTSFSNRYQALLVSGTNIKTVNSNSLIGSGNIAVGDALVANPLSQFASTPSSGLRGVLNDETGNGLAYFQNGDLGTPSAGVGTNFTGIPNSALNNSSLTIGSTNIALGATAATIAGLTLTAPIITGTPSTPSAGVAIGSSTANRFNFTGQNGFLVSFNANGLTASRGFVLPDAAGTLATTNGGQTFTSAIWTAAKIAEIYGGTNQSTYTTGDLLYASASNTLSKLGIGSTGNVLTVSGGTPAWGTVSAALGYTPANDANVVHVTGTETIAGAKIFTSNLSAVNINSTSAQTTINGSTSGTITASMPFQGSSYKKVIVYGNTLSGTATYTFPTAFTTPPGVIAGGAGITAISSSSVTASNFSGIIIIEGY